MLLPQHGWYLLPAFLRYCCGCCCGGGEEIPPPSSYPWNRPSPALHFVSLAFLSVSSQFPPHTYHRKPGEPPSLFQLLPSTPQELLAPLWRTEMPLVRVIVDMEGAGLGINEAILDTGELLLLPCLLCMLGMHPRVWGGHEATCPNTPNRDCTTPSRPSCCRPQRSRCCSGG